MEIKVSHTISFVHVSIAEGAATIDLGLLDDSERDDLARTLLDATFQMGPEHHNECVEWFAGMLNRCGFELPNKAVDLPPREG